MEKNYKEGYKSDCFDKWKTLMYGYDYIYMIK